MKASITKEELTKALSIVSKGMSSRSTLPILSGILLVAADKELVLQTTDLEISIKCTVSAFVEQEGQTVVPGKLFNDIVRSFADAAVQITTSGDHIKLECLDSSFELNTLDANDFPHFPEVEANTTVTLPVARLSSMIKQVYKATSKDEHRVVLTGVLFSIEGSDISLVATDSYRLAISEATLASAVADSFEVIVPGKLFDDVLKSASDDDNITIGVAENQIVFAFGTTVFVTRKIEGNYPNYKQLIPSDKNMSAKVKTSDFISAVRRVSLLAQSNTSIKFAFSVEDQKITVSSQAQDIGQATESVSAEIEGEDVEIGFNHQFILDGLTSIDSDETLIELQTALKPGIFKSMGEDKMLYLAMPVRLG